MMEDAGEGGGRCLDENIHRWGQGLGRGDEGLRMRFIMEDASSIGEQWRKRAEGGA